jgi:mannosyltransferase OCH1-like enzyme
MEQEGDSPEHHRQRSEFIRKLVQSASFQPSVNERHRKPIPRTIVQFWHDFGRLPFDVEQCIQSWTVWKASGFKHRLFDERTAATFINSSLGARYKRVFERCYHPAMQADYFRLCYAAVEGGLYVDADDVCVSTAIDWLANDGRLKLQPLCYDTAKGTMVEPAVFLRPGAFEPSWIVYFNNNPLITCPRHPVIEHALEQATSLFELAGEDELPEIQSATGPGNISKSIFTLAMDPTFDIESDVAVLGEWDSIAVSKWPLSYRNDARNWRLSNQRKFGDGG